MTNLVKFHGDSGWYILQTGESYNGVRTYWFTHHPIFLEWFSNGALGGTNYSHTPVGGVSHVDEPGTPGYYSDDYFGLWARGKPFAICAWYARKTITVQVVGDPFVRR